MLDRHSLFFWSLPLMRIAGVEVRVSWMLALVAVVIGLQAGWVLGFTYVALMFLVVLLHEFGHVIAARATGGSAEEIVLSPFGGLAAATPGPGYPAHIITAAGGPLVNLVICGLLFPGLYAPAFLPQVLLPEVPIVELHSESLGMELMLLTFHASWVLLVINLLPVIPFDGGQMLQAALSMRLPAERVFRGMIVAGFVTAVLLMLGGLIWDWAGLVILGALVLVINLMQSMQEGSGDYRDDSFMGYDFSQGYTSLERSSGPTTETEVKTSSWQRWKERRQARKLQLDKERQEHDEAQLDALLAKVHEQGMQALSPAEKRLLQRVSTEYRERTKRQS